MKTNFRWLNLILIICMVMGVNALSLNEAKAADRTVGTSCTYPTINAAITAADPGDRLLIEGGVTFYENITIGKNLTLQGGYNGCGSGSSTATTVDGGGINYVFEISGCTVTLQQLQITGGSTGNGGGIRVLSGAQVTLDQTDVFLNTAGNGGGAYINPDCQLTLNSSNIYDNTATINGGGARVWGTLTANDNYSDIYGNSAPNGGGLSVPGGIVHLISADMYQNQATAAEGKGGAIHVSGGGEITLSNSAYIYFLNQAYDGAGIYADGSTVTSEGSNVVFRQNDATNNGGAIYLGNGSVLSLNNASVGQVGVSLKNQALRGAGIYVADSTVNLTDVILTQNTATGYGGAIYAYSGDLNLSNTTIQDNSADIDGGAIYQEGGTIDFTGAWSVDNNSANGNGGALAISGTGITSFIANGETGSLINNQAAGHGGAVYLHNASTMKFHATVGYNLNVLNNLAGGNGGALYADSGGYFDIYGQVNFDHNRADNGGAIHLSNGSRVWTDDYENTCPQLWDNWAVYGSGGAIYAVDSPSVQCDGAIFGKSDDGNQAAVSGGAIYLSNSTFDADNCIFADNKAVEHGGAIAADDTSSLNIHATYTSPSPSLVAKPTAEIERLEGPTTRATGRDPVVQPCSVFSGNIADRDSDASTGYGGAIYLNTSALTMVYTHLYNNSAERGGAIYQVGETPTAEVSNSLIYGNTSTAGLGAGIRTGGGTFTLTHVTLGNNINGAGYSQSNTDGHVTNSIAWGNASGGFWVTSGTIDGTCNIDQSGNVGSAINPRFVDAASGDFHLLDDSPAIDTCDTGLSPDLRNRLRPNGVGYDMGAYEYYLEYTVEAVTNPEGGGTVSGSGTYLPGYSVTVNASAAPGYAFVHWTDANRLVSCSSSYSFPATDDISLQANFSPEQSAYDITCSISQLNHGFTTGTGSYSHDANATVIAYPDFDYAFVKWIETWDGFEGSCVVSTQESYSFTAKRDRNLTAIIRPKALPGVMLLLLDEN